jgi:hypothetical protein
MDARDQGQQAAETNGICRLEWIALAIEAARRHKEVEQRTPAPGSVRHLSLVPAASDPARR